MKDRIEQFVWGCQQHFRSNVRYETQNALESVGFRSDVYVLLVAFAQDIGTQERSCVEPEDGSVTSEAFVGVQERAEAIYRASPNSTLLTDNPLHRIKMHEGFRNAARAEAIKEVLELSAEGSTHRFFVSKSGVIDGYIVHTCIGIDKISFDSLPSSRYRDSRGEEHDASLQRCVIAECLRRADSALSQPDAGTGLRILGNTRDIVISAAESLTGWFSYEVTGMPSDLVQYIEACSALEYEQKPAHGRVLLSKSDSPSVRSEFRLAKPVDLGDSRALRVLLELSDDQLAVLATERHAYALGRINSDESVLEIVIISKMHWLFRADNVTLLEFRHGHPMLPRSPIDGDRLRDVTRRTVGEVDDDYLLAVARSAQECGHGMTLVVSTNASEELQRLGGEAFPIDPIRLDPTEVIRLSSVDGAVLLDCFGVCHAFGVILDGVASGYGDRVRGSRFNSAVRYQRTQVHKSVVVVISSDGSVDVLPSLMPRVSRCEVQDAVEDFCTLCRNPGVDGEEFARAYQRVAALDFYLDAEQCDSVNQGRQTEMDRRTERQQVVVRQPPLRPSPEMDDSYFL